LEQKTGSPPIRDQPRYPL